MKAITDLRMLNDIDAVHSLQYVKLARILRTKMESREYEHGDILAFADLARDYKVSLRVAWRALAMLAANRYVTRPGDLKPYQVVWRADVS